MYSRSRLHVRYLAFATVVLTSARAVAQEPAADTQGTQKHVYDEKKKEEAKGEPKPAGEQAEKPADKAYVTVTPDDGFRINSADDDYMLRIGLAMGIKYEPLWTNGDAQKNGLLAFMRPSIRGHFFKPWINYQVAFELAADTPFLLSGNLDFTPWDEFSFRVGQQGTPVSRHTSQGVQNVFFADFATVSGYFWSGRQKGITAYGSVLDKKIDYWAGLYGGSPLRETSSDPHNYIVEGRITANPWGPVNGNELPFTSDGGMLPTNASFTLQGYHGKLQQTRENSDPTNSPLDAAQSPLLQTMSTGGADIWLQSGRFILFGEYFVRYLGSSSQLAGRTSQGAWGQIIANAWANKIGVGARVGWIDPSSELSNDNVVEAEGQVAWFIRPPQLALKARYGYVHQSTPDATAQGSLTLPFATGTTHLATLQLSLVF